MKSQIKFLLMLFLITTAFSCKKDAELIVKEEVKKEVAQSGNLKSVPSYTFGIRVNYNGTIPTSSYSFTFSPTLQSGQSSLSTIYSAPVYLPNGALLYPASNRFDMYTNSSSWSPNANLNTWYTITPPNFSVQNCDEFIRIKFLTGYTRTLDPDISYNSATKKFTVNNPNAYSIVEKLTPCLGGGDI